MPESSLTSPARLEMIIFRQGICRLWMRQIIYSRGGTLIVYVAEVFLWASRIRSATRGCATIWVRHGLATGQAILESVFLDLSSSICHSIMSQSVTRDELRLFFCVQRLCRQIDLSVVNKSLMVSYRIPMQMKNKAYCLWWYIIPNEFHDDQCERRQDFLEEDLHNG